MRKEALSISGRDDGSPSKFIWGLRKFFAEVTSVIPRLIRICASKRDIFNLLEISDCSPLLGGDKTHLLLIEYIYLTKRQEIVLLCRNKRYNWISPQTRIKNESAYTFKLYSLSYYAL